MRKKIARTLLGILLFVVFVSCQSGLYTFDEGFGIPQRSKEEPLVQFIIASDPTYDDDLSHFAKTLEYAKIPMNQLSPKAVSGRSFTKRSTRVICLAETWDLSSEIIDSLTIFVAKGGTLLITERNWDERLAFLMGLNPDYDMRIDDSSKGIKLQTDVLPGLKGFALPGGSTAHRGLARSNFAASVQILATARNNEDYPLITENKIGHGRVLLYNSANRFGKAGRGLFFGMLLRGLEGVPYPIVNAATIFLDDFPAPVYDIYKEPVKSEMKKNVAEFVTDVWWPDMKSLAERKGIKFTAYVTFDYNTRIAPPFMFSEWDRSIFRKDNINQSRSTWLGHDVLASGHELGLHGYNHVSLLNSEWKERQHMESALNAARKKWLMLDLGKMPVSYVPPSNYIDSIGTVALSNTFPSIKYIQSTYMGDFAEGGGREFDPEPWGKQFFSFPRISSGFVFSPVAKFEIASLYLYTGIWSHFVHPDDVFQIPDMSNANTAGDFELRNPDRLNWRTSARGEGMFERFARELELLQKRQPLMRFLDATTAANQTANWRYAYFEHLQLEDLYTVASNHYRSDPKHEQYWHLFVRHNYEKEVDRFLADQEAEHKKVNFNDGLLYTIRTPKAFLTLPNLYKNSSFQGVSSSLRTLTFNWRDQFKAARQQVLPVLARVADLIEKGEIAKAAGIMESYLLSGTQVTAAQWKEYLKLLQWVDRGPEIWHTLEAAYKTDGNNSIVSMARIISESEPYPNAHLHRKWLRRIIEWNPDELSAMLEYLEYFNQPEEKFYIADIYGRIAEIRPTEENKKKYLQHLLDFEMEAVFGLLEEINPCAPEYSDVSYAISWAYANRQFYDRALAWSECSPAIDQESRNFWLLQSGLIDRIRDTDQYTYFDILLRNEPIKAVAALQKVESCMEELRGLAGNISRALAAHEYYQKAIEWSQCSQDIPTGDMLLWYYETGQYQNLEKVYQEYISRHPTDQEVKLTMAEIELYRGNVTAAAAILKTLEQGREYQRVKSSVNRAVRDLEIDSKRIMVKDFSDLLYPNTRARIVSEIRAERGNSLVFTGNALNDKLDPTVLTLKAGYDLVDNSNNIHSVQAVRNYSYPINFVRASDDNTGTILMGLEYEFISRFKNNRNYNFSGRLENDEKGKTFFHLGVSMNRNRKENFHGYSLNYAPVQTGPGYFNGIYRLHAQMHHQIKLAKRLTESVSFEANYYTDEVYSGELLARTYYTVVRNKNWDMGPIGEASYALATLDRRDGFPYWVADNRFFAGGGLQLNIGKPESPFYFQTSAAHFYENQDEPSFERYTGILNFRVKKFTRINLSAEVYTIPRFFSNSFGLGLIHNL